MKPVHEHFGHGTYDLTEGKIHKIANPDGSQRVVAFFPKKWNVRSEVLQVSINGRMAMLKHYEVIEWEEIVLATIPAPTIKPEKTE